MKFMLSSLLFALPAVQAVGEIGFALGASRNSDGQCKQQSDWESDFDAMKKLGSSNARVYASSDCNTLQNVGPAAENKGVTVYLGVWATPNDHFNAEKAALQSHLPSISKSTIGGILVGSEALYRNDLSASDLASEINNVRDLIKNIKDKNGDSYDGVQVGTVDSWNLLVQDSANDAISASDFVFANEFPYWQGQGSNNMTNSFFDSVTQALQHIEDVKGTDDFNFWVGETGWPTEGENYGDATPNVDTAEQYWKEAVCGMRGLGVNVFFFELYDESYKPQEKGKSSVERHWGILNSDGSPKFDLQCSFD